MCHNKPPKSNTTMFKVVIVIMALGCIKLSSDKQTLLDAVKVSDRIIKRLSTEKKELTRRVDTLIIHCK